ncbi:hypothetical protein [Streptococcus uberis]
MTQTEIITVVGISNKEEKKQGWLACVKSNTASWKTFLIPFNKENFGTVISQLGVYEVEISDLSSAFGSRPKYEISEARLIVSFDEILKTYK